MHHVSERSEEYEKSTQHTVNSILKRSDRRHFEPSCLEFIKMTRSISIEPPFGHPKPCHKYRSACTVGGGWGGCMGARAPRSTKQRRHYPLPLADPPRSRQDPPRSCHRILVDLGEISVDLLRVVGLWSFQIPSSSSKF